MIHDRLPGLIDRFVSKFAADACESALDKRFQKTPRGMIGRQAKERSVESFDVHLEPYSAIPNFLTFRVDR